MAVAREIVREKDSVYRRAQVPCGGAVYGDENLLFIANDWHTALLPVFLQAYYRDHGKLTYARCALVIHNMAHQGRGPLAEFQRLGIPDQYRDAFYLDDPFGGECMNILKAGLTTAHRLVAVSHGYAWRASPPPPPPTPLAGSTRGRVLVREFGSSPQACGSDSAHSRAARGGDAARAASDTRAGVPSFRQTPGRSRRTWAAGAWRRC